MITKRDLLRSAAFAAMTITAAKSSPASAQTKAEWPDIREAKAIAEEGFIYGLPIVMNYVVMYEYSVDKNSGQYKAPFNQIKNEARVYTYKDTAVITPNSDTPYSLLWLDLRAEPIVLSVPAVDKSRYYSVMLCDGNTFNYGYIGSRATGSEAGDYMVVGPDWKGATPPGIKKVFQSSTQFSAVAYRTQLFDAADMPNVEKVQAGYKVQPLSAYLKQPATVVAARRRLSKGECRAGEEELLRISRLRSPIRAGRTGGKRNPRQARTHRRRSRKDLRFQGSSADAQD